MEYQNLLVLLFVTLSAGLIIKGVLRSARGNGCASGCGSCKSTTCALQKSGVRIRHHD
jgi:hypothetical protein